MKFTTALLIGAVAVSAQQVSVADVPGCAIPCFIQNVPSTGCGLTDVNCQCQPSNKSKLTALITPCVLKACSTQNALKTQMVTNQLCEQAGFGGGSSGGSSSSSAAASSSSSSAAASSSSSAAATSSAAASSSAAAPAPAASTPAGGSAPAPAPASGTASAMPTSYTGAASKMTNSFGAVAAGVVAAFAL